MNMRLNPGQVRRACAAAVAFCLLASCADRETHTTVQASTGTPAAAATPATPPAPVELRRFGAAPAGDAGRSGSAAGIYRGTGVLYAPVASPAGTGAKVTAAGDFSLNFVNTDIREVAAAVLGDLLGLNYVVDATIQGAITVQTTQPLAKDDVLPAFETVLRANGLALVRQGAFYSVVPFGGASKTVGLRRSEEGYGTEIAVLHYVSPEQMRKVLEPLVPQGTIVQVDPSRNMLVVGGSEGERAAVREQIATFDVDWMRGMSFALFTPRYATAKELASDLTHVMGDEGSPMAGQVKLVAIDRMNAVLAITHQARYLDELKTWVDRLDRGNDTTDRRIFVYYVQNGRAKDLAGVLGKALGIRSNDASAQQSGAASAAQAANAGQSSGSSFGQAGSGGAGSGLGSSSGFGQSTISRPQGGMSGGSDPGGSLPGPDNGEQQNGMPITADEANNALLIVATRSEYQVVEAALRQLDILPLQVLIEASIVEVTLTKDLNFGVQWNFNNGTNNLTLSGTNSPSIGPSFPGFNYLYTGGNKITAVLSALQDITQVNVLSSPELMVLNNQTAVLQVGKEVPVATQSSVSNLTAGAPTVNSIDYRDTGVLLTITPRVNEGGLVLMDISQEVSDVSQTTSSTLNSPTINQRKIGSTVAIQNGQTIALGGLITEQKTDGNSGVPYLKDVPVLGNLFRQDTNQTIRSELLVLITPRVIRDGRDAAAASAEMRSKLSDLKAEIAPAGSSR